MYKIFGCKVNKFYINQWLNYYQTQNIPLNNVLLIATCVVTDRAKNKWLKETLKALKNGMQVAITGCGTLNQGQLISETAFFSLYPELEAHKMNLSLVGEAPKNPSSTTTTKNPAEKGLRTKQFLMIQNGCDNHCSFCLTILKRGKHRSRPAKDIIAEIQQIEANGGKEIVLTGINLMARGASTTKNPAESRFPELLEIILQQTNIPRIRISSIGPEYANDHFFDLAQDSRILPHFHYSIQSFSDKILKKMKRNYNQKLLDEILKKTKNLRKDTNKEKMLISIGADLIIGFPGETEADFLETLNGIQEYEITKLHAFPFSDHHKGESVPASFYPHQIPQEIKKEREARLLAIGEKIRAEFIAKNKGTTHQVLIEEKKNGKRKGWTENYIQKEVEGAYQKGEIVEIIL